jgi:hypothetical protein
MFGIVIFRTRVIFFSGNADNSIMTWFFANLLVAFWASLVWEIIKKINTFPDDDN